MKLALRSDGSGLVRLPSFTSITEVTVNAIPTTAFTVVLGTGIQFSPIPPEGFPIEVTFVEDVHIAGVENSAAKVTSVANTKRYDQVDATTAYLGEAVVGTLEAKPSWRIQKLIFTAGGSVTILFADGDSNFNNVWADRATLSYA